MLEKIISGGQTGVDRAGLDAAIKLNIPHGGWCPLGRLSESGIIPKKYLLKETDSDDYSVRTKLNIVDSDGTLILIPDAQVKIMDGTVLTINEVKARKKPYLVIDLTEAPSFNSIIKWIEGNDIGVLNVAGPRESSSPGIYSKSLIFFEKLFDTLLKNEASNSVFKAKL